ncbi:RluA family pseudouridine synthase [Sphingobium bisphenolivorans]|uniref:RluA family pseudouridine synthase n=1 Tax=Sphingobium bisphenolivorans TaxID=1335760 RepID=UPI0003A6302D|nr:RNA pseudouridine synthase [Sphingobium bisphenolivorans]
MSLLHDRVIFIDGEALIIDKPAGLPVDAPRDGSLSLENHLSSLTFGFQRWPLPVHRLDRDTSGCLLLARNPKAHKRYAAAFEAGTVSKRYVAVVDGVPEEESGTIELALKKISSAAKGWRMIPAREGKAAATDWRRIAVRGSRALIAFTPRTGRTHQIRAHALHGLGFGIVGDPVYGQGSETMLLHSRFLSIPRGEKPPAEATAPLPPSFAAAGFGAEYLDEAGI